MKNVSNGFEVFMKDTNGVGQAFMEATVKMSQASSLEEKVQELAYISSLVTARMYGGLPFHIGHARELGATDDEIKSAILVPLPLVGIQVVEALPYLSQS